MNRPAQSPISAQWHRLRRDLPDGREWLVTTTDNPSGRPHTYAVPVWTDPELGRVAACRCAGFNAGQLCRHIKYIQPVDSLLTRAPLRTPRPVH